jgi:hypothetical protein
MTAGREHGVLVIAANYENGYAEQGKLFPTHRGTLTLSYKTDGNAGDRYELCTSPESGSSDSMPRIALSDD